MVDPPKDIFDKPLTLDMHGLFFVAAETLVKTIVSPISFFEGIVKMFSQVGFEPDPPGLVWRLLATSMTNAIASTLEDHSDLLNVEDPVLFKKKSKEIDDQLRRTTVKLDRNFFDAPDQMAFAQEMQQRLESWVKYAGTESFVAANIAGKLPPAFKKALRSEWRRGLNKYRDLEGYIVTPFDKTNELELRWSEYAAWLDQQVDERVFGESFGLRQIYHPLSCYQNKKDEVEYREIYRVDDYIEHWLGSRNKSDSFRIVSGGPGSGKSTIAQMTAALASKKKEYRTVFIPLHLFTVKDSLISSLNQFANESQLLPDVICGSDQSPLLVVFDGLDELANQGNNASEKAEELIRQIRVGCVNYNQTSRRLSVLLFGRTLFIQRVEQLAGLEEQTIHLLPYKEDRKANDKDPHKLLPCDYRLTWWKRYCELSFGKEVSMPATLTSEILGELSTQPLLCYLLAITNFSDECADALTTPDDPDKNFNLNLIYEQILIDVFGRDFEGKSIKQNLRILPKRIRKKLDYPSFLNCLQDIAIVTWKNNARTASIKSILEQCESTGRSTVLKTLQEDVEEGAMSLLTAFYFRREDKGHPGEKTFEFTHKSFCEYLTSKYIVRLLDDMSDSHNHKKDLEEDFRVLHQLFSQNRIDGDLSRFLLNEIQLLAEEKQISLQHFLTSLLDLTVDREVELQLSDFKLSSIEQSIWNVEYGLWALHHACFLVTRERSELESGDVFTLQKIFRRSMDLAVFLKSMRFEEPNLRNVSLIRRPLGAVDFKGATFDACDLTKADFRDAELTGAYIVSCNAHGVLFDRASLRSSIFTASQFAYSFFSGADLRGAMASKTVCMQRCHFKDSDLSEAILSGINMKEADFSNATLLGTNLSYCDLSSAKFLNADCRSARFTLACLNEADLSGADLTGAQLAGASMRNAKLANVDLTGADLTDADLTDADLTGTDTNNTDITGAVLNGTKFG